MSRHVCPVEGCGREFQSKPACSAHQSVHKAGHAGPEMLVLCEELEGRLNVVYHAAGDVMLRDWSAVWETFFTMKGKITLKYANHRKDDVVAED